MVKLTYRTLRVHACDMFLRELHAIIKRPILVKENSVAFKYKNELFEIKYGDYLTFLT